MIEFILKMKALEKDLSQENGSFSVFALIKREDTPQNWDIVVAAPWLEVDYLKSLRYLVQKVQSRLSPDEILRLSGVMLLNSDDEFVKEINASYVAEHQDVELRDVELNGMAVGTAHIITSLGTAALGSSPVASFSQAT